MRKSTVKENFFTRWLNKRRAKKLPKLYRGQYKFLSRYPRFSMGLGSYGMPTVHDWADGTTLTIGAFTSIADEVHIFLGGGHRSDWVTSYPFPEFIDEVKDVSGYRTTRGNVSIGNDVWLASGCTILSGVTVGDGAIVAARSVVTHDVPPYAVVAGNPAKIVRWRFDEDIRLTLQESQWWQWPEEEIRRIAPLLCSDRISAFIDYAKARSNQ